MFLRLEHLGIAVKDLAAINDLYGSLFATGPYKQEEVVSEHVKTSFFQLGEAKVEFLEATHPDSAIAKHIEKRGEGLHHVAFEVDDIRAEMERLKFQGFQLLNEEPKMGADNKLVCFLHPKGTNSVLVELCQAIR
ncbi:MAG: methylmalonyl-CoA epimerase [Haliscomenobacter sp.]|nr:methylmalonyl-CoA epimerase [Haliscomenobacter sp.]MBK8879469.1 methylmalonyl-CoA epimerase [Haliscomenobacter sp.]